MDGHRHPTIRHTVSLSSAAYLGRLLHIFPPSPSLHDLPRANVGAVIVVNFTNTKVGHVIIP